MYSNDSAQVEFIMLDASCLHEIAIAKANQTRTEIVQWFHSILGKDRIVIVPEIVRYVVHRQLQLDRQSRVAFALEDLLKELVCIPIDSEITKRAAVISADFRQENTELTLSMLDSLDKDAILIAQHDKFKEDRKGKVNLVLTAFENNHSPLQGINIKNWRNISMKELSIDFFKTHSCSKRGRSVN
ncbi:MAG: type II toxin-antitoxin system VapC family toxin [Microcystis aeruginosa LL13-03]|jgi:hypothetical protein|nr:type II toxin-antitoxin system VapC family toxin [Microcystis aeruginosa LL13-03]NCR65590.1 type II toxin-antitoxin system VapC family toxin [Microcystis aeruginosa LL11-07]NCS03661.1 type II toxin-antitoxin system VapC family toxin [Microcystis aeruginosa G13-11]NCS05638.1 type II toxin-antitoxin system VapC family toxin [Microcystis aeruginosa G13-07]NCS21759.1 type II toxin-antitoxin system VapC family toxin [Microcystis aeruginosa G11-06]